MWGRLKNKVYRSIFCKKLYWRSKLIELLINRFLLIYYSLIIRFVSPLWNSIHSVEYLSAIICKIIILSIISIFIITRAVFNIKKFKLLKNLVRFFSFLKVNIKYTIWRFFNEWHFSQIYLSNRINVKIFLNSNLMNNIVFYLKRYTRPLIQSISASFLNKRVLVYIFKLLKNYFTVLQIHRLLVNKILLSTLGLKYIKQIFQFIKTLNKSLMLNYYRNSSFINNLSNKLYLIDQVKFYKLVRLPYGSVIYFRYNIFFKSFLILNVWANNNKLTKK